MRAFAAIAFLCVLSVHAHWYDGIDSIKVLSPSDSFDWKGFYSSMRHAQFDDTRHAILLTSGNYDKAHIGVGYYTSIIGVGATRNDVVVQSFYSKDYIDGAADTGGACNNFWRSVEGVTATATSLTWATSQSCPIRRSVVQGDLELSELGAGIHWSSGGFIGDVEVKGSLRCGSQQQFFFRNSQFEGGVSCSALYNGAFVGSHRKGSQSISSHVSIVSSTPTVAEKPFLVENNNHWHIAVPNVKSASSGIGDDLDVTQIPMHLVFVAQAGQSAAAINSGIQGMKALLLTPGIYVLEEAIVISQASFVVLGIGFPTLVSQSGHSALIVDKAASHVRVAMVLFEAGTWMRSKATAAMFLWKGSHGIGSDIFSRVGAFSGRGCHVTRADVHVQIDGSHTVLDNSWLWHADHDDCSASDQNGHRHSLSDASYDSHALQVDGQSVTVYGLKAEHTLGNLVQWNGEDGSVFFYQAELPYHAKNFGSSGFSGYVVHPSVTRHHGVALGVYIIYEDMTKVTAFRMPEGLHFENILAWVATSEDTSQFRHLACVGKHCYAGKCSGNQCRMTTAPSSLMLV